MGDVERLWTAARGRHGQHKDRRTPSAGISAVLVALLHAREAHVTELAALSNQDQGTLSGHWLPKLSTWGFAEKVGELTKTDEHRGYGHQGGGQAAHLWSLTPDGRRLAKALIVEQVAA
jgi:hypothetical protein